MTAPSRTIALVALATLVVACSRSRITEPLAALPFATATPSCGPADGPAVEITLAATGEPAVTPHLRLVIYEGLTRLRGRWTLGSDVGFASYVPSSGAPEGATRGTVEIEQVDAANTVTGTVDVVFERAGTFKGRFRATWVARVVMCG
jgi:hypothetical protein